MVAAQKHFQSNPAYGSMPTGTPEGRAEAARRRAEANRRRRRNRVIGWAVAIAFLIAVAAVGFFAYRSYQDESDGMGARHGEFVSVVTGV
jgi:ferric-dicitrate binding protein FerR (iron transport regulator)